MIVEKSFFKQTDLISYCISSFKSFYKSSLTGLCSFLTLTVKLVFGVLKLLFVLTCIHFYFFFHTKLYNSKNRFKKVYLYDLASMEVIVMFTSVNFLFLLYFCVCVRFCLIIRWRQFLNCLFTDQIACLCEINF